MAHRGEGKAIHPGRIKDCDDPVCEEVWIDYCNDESTVSCDDMCGAQANPSSPEQFIEGYWHWKSHDVTGGCSHGN